MDTIIIFVETKGDEVRKASVELLCEGARLSAGGRFAVEAVCCGPLAEGVKARLLTMTPRLVHLTDASLAAYSPEGYAYAMANYAREVGAKIVMAGATGIYIREWCDLLPCYVEMWKMGARGYAYVYFADYAARFPEDADALHKMAWLLATAKPSGLTYARMAEWPQAAVRWAEGAAMQPDNRLAVETQDALGAARAYAGDFSGAGRAAEKARDLARDKGEDAVAAQIDKRILTYRTGLPWRE